MTMHNAAMSLPPSDRDDELVLSPPESPTKLTAAPGLALPGVALELDRIERSVAAARAALTSLEDSEVIAGWALLRAHLRRVKLLSSHLESSVFSSQQQNSAPIEFGARAQEVRRDGR